MDKTLVALLFAFVILGLFRERLGKLTPYVTVLAIAVYMVYAWRHL